MPGHGHVHVGVGRGEGGHADSLVRVLCCFATVGGCGLNPARRRRGVVEEAQQFHRERHDQVLFFSAATSVTVCSSRSCRAAGSAAITVAASANRVDAWYSPSAAMTGAALAFGSTGATT